MIALHLGGIPETAMVLGPILLIVALLRIARRNEATLPDEEHDDWDADLGDLPVSKDLPVSTKEPAEGRTEGPTEGPTDGQTGVRRPAGRTAR